MNIIEANLRFADASGQLIDCEVLFKELGSHVAFTASASDKEDYGRGIYAAAIAGEYGPIAPFAPKPLASYEVYAALTAEYERRMQAIAEDYPPSERESWPVQTSEAYALLADSTAQTPDRRRSICPRT